MNCNPQSLMEQAKCFRCIPSGNVPSVISYLMCQWANSPKGVLWTPASAQANWSDINGAQTGDLPTFLANADMASVTLLQFGPGYGHAQITSLTGLSTLPLLSQIDATSCLLTTIDISNCTQLTSAILANNQISGTLTVSNCPNLIGLYVNTNQITAVNITGSPNINFFDASNNQITSINLNQLTSLFELYLDGNPLTGLDLSPLTTINILTCSNCGLNSLNLSLASLFSLATLDVSFNNLAALDFFFIAAIQTITCNSNVLTSVDITNDTVLGILSANDNLLTEARFDIGQLGLFQINLRNNVLTPANVPFSVDDILNTINNSASLGNFGTLDLDGTGNASPTGGPLNPDYVNLIANGWTVNIN